ncbi:MAG TPA: NAD(P)/FAD-dependent oxidoreductase [Vicinamibacteria bacterium]|nr:NAD(P)/FAD-dependent oxidoreductase [Vicinamibacteria bacterium]
MKHDVIVVGARCAGASTALLLARQGRRVLLVDKAVFPSDTLSTHYVHASGVARLKRWGVVDEIARSGCPPIPSVQFDFDPLVIRGTPPPLDGVSHAYAPRRAVLDQILVREALKAGVEWREAFTLEELIVQEGRVVGIRGHHRGGAPVTERAGLVVGADGRYSRVAELVGAAAYHERPPLTCMYYSYWSGVSLDRIEIYVRERRSLLAFPTHAGLTVVVAVWPHREFAAVQRALEKEFLAALELAPSLAERVRAGVREEPFRGTGDLPNRFRKAFGPGWALVGDAGCHKDPLVAQGIMDAFRDADLLAAAGDDLAEYARRRDEAALDMYELTCQRAALEPPPPEMVALLAAIRENQSAIDQFVGVDAGTVPVREFFSPENVRRLTAMGPT